MRDFVKRVLLRIWPFSLFMRRIQELHEKNETFSKSIDENLREMSAKAREIQNLSQDLESAQQELENLKNSGIYVTWTSIEKARQTAANYKEWRADHFITEMINDPSSFDEMEQMFEDEESLKVFYWIILYRFLIPIFGESALWVKPELSLLYHIFPGPISEEKFRETYARAEEAAAAHSMVLFAEPYCVWHTFILKQYQYEALFQYHDGDVVFDIGGYVGDTAIFFSNLVGESGKVITFEPHPTNIKLIQENINHFNRKNIQLEKFALSDAVGEQVFAEQGSSSAGFADSGIVVKTTTLDQYTFKNEIKKISVIKMDVEGAEESVLRGGMNTIRRLRPVLLISVYHGGNGYYGDFTRISLYLKKSLPGYRFYLRHKNTQIGETVLVCVPGIWGKDEVISSSSFWDRCYQCGRTSGTGSYGLLAQFKSEVINDFVRRENIQSVLEIGCGDGNQLKMMEYANYVGVDVSPTIVERNRNLFKDDMGKNFFCTLTEREKYVGKQYDLVLSMDVIFHLLEDDVFHQYMDDLFTLSGRFVIVYSSNHEEYTPWPEYRHRNFTGYVAEHYPDWKLIQYIPNRYPYQIGKESETSASDFYIFQKQET